jgi:Tol biopolymer transport system component
MRVLSRSTALIPVLLGMSAAMAGAATSPAQGKPAVQDTTKKSPKKGLPLTATRNIAFTTDQGTWMSVDVSPDGKTLVFDLLGDLYTVPMAGGTATRLTSGLPYDAQPRFSPDGKTIAFVSDRDGGNNIWTLSLDLKDTTQVTTGKSFEYASPEWTPDGEYIVASKGTRIEQLWMFHRNGGAGAQLIKEPATLKTLGAAFGSDPRYIWFAERTGDWEYNAIFPQYQIAVYDRRTGKRTVMTDRVGSAFRPTISPDGTWMVYGTRLDAKTGLILRNQETGRERWLAYPVQRDDEESVAPLDVLPGMSFTPDGKDVVASYGGGLWKIPVDGSAPTKIPFSADVDIALGPLSRFEYRVDTSPTFTAHQIRDAAPSPDGKRLAFAAMDKLYVVDYPDGTPRRLTETGAGMVEAQPTWSPDGTQLAFVSWSDTDGGYIWKVAANGRAAPVKLTPEGALYREVAWSPDGARIVAVRVAARDLHEAKGMFRGGLGAHFVWVAAAGGEVHEIAPTGGRGNPHFTDDPDRIYAYSGEDGLVSFRWDGTDERGIVKVTGKTVPGSRQPMRADEVLMAPKGDQALVLLDHELYAITVPMIGGETPTISLVDASKAQFPARQLSVVGGEFPAWSADGRTAHWSIGDSHFVFDLDRAKAFDDSVKAARGSEEPDSAGAAKKPARYEAESHEVRIPVQRDIPTGVAVLRGARIITMKGDEVIENGDIVIKDNHIEAVGARGSVQVPEGAKIIDVSGKTIVPGFVDTHYHPQWLVPEIHSSQAWQYLAELAYGTTTTRDPQTATTDVLTYEDKVADGEMVGPRIYSTGPGVFSSEMISSLDDARHVLERYSKYYDTKTLKMYMTGNREQRQWVIMAAHELGLTPTTEGGLDYKLEMTHIMDGYAGVEHALPIEPKYKDAVDLLARSQTVNSPTLIVSYGGPFGENYFYTNTDVHGDAKLAHFTPHQELDARTRRRGSGSGGSPGPGGWFMDDEYVFPLHAKFAKDVVDAGGRVGIGSHGQLQGLGMHWEMWMMATGGMTPMQVLQSATMSGAWAIGLEHDIGSLEPGKLADLVVLDANPLDDIHNTNTIRWVMKNGRMYDGDTLDEVWPRQRKLPPLLWHEPEPNTEAGIR